MHKLGKIVLNSLVIGLIALPVLVLAQVGGMSGSGSGLSIQRIGINIANAVWIVFTIIAVIAFVVAGVMFLTAYGEAEKVKKARSAFLWGVVGVVVAILAFGIIKLVESAIGA